MTRNRIIKGQVLNLSRRRERIFYLKLLFICFIIAATVWGYYDTLDDFFIMDDFDMIRGHSSFKQFLHHWYAPVGGNTYRPLIDLLFIWDFHWWGWNPLGWHLSNLFFHLMNVLLVFKLGQYLTKSFYAGIFTGLLFGLHPGNSEAVIWISARMDVVCTTCLLLSIHSFIFSTTEQGLSLTHQKKRQRAYILSLICFACALLIKESAVTLPLLIILYDLTFSTDWKHIHRDIWKKVKLYLPYLLVFFLYFVIRAMVVSNAHEYSSNARGLLGGYDVKIAGTFLFGNIDWYFKNLMRPFWEEIFSASLLINLLGIAIVTLCCFALSKISRFVMLWIWITLMPVCFLRIHRGVYLVSIGFCLMMGMLLTFVPEKAVSFSLFNNKTLRIMVRVFQIVLIAALFLRYGIAREEANAWWSDVAEINEKVPLMVKAMYPSFPEGSRICIQNMPLVLNQRVNNAFRFRYPDSHFGGIHVKDFEQCVQKEDPDTVLSDYFFFYYKDKLIYDFTFETRERMTSPYLIDIQRLPDSPEYKLSAETPQVHVDFDISTPCSAIGIVTSLANGIDVPQEAIVAHGQVEGSNGTVEMFEIVAGKDTAEWAIRFPHIQKIVQHEMPQPYRVWTVGQPEGSFVLAQNYLKYVKFHTPFVPIKLSLKFLRSSKKPSNLTLDLNRIVFYTENKEK